MGKYICNVGSEVATLFGTKQTSFIYYTYFFLGGGWEEGGGYSYLIGTTGTCIIQSGMSP